MNVNKLLKLLTWILTWELWIFKFLNFQRVVIKTNFTWPFCIRPHIHVRPDTLVAFVMTNTQKKLITQELPLFCMATKNKFNCHRIGNQKFLVAIINYWLLIDTMIMIALMVTKTHFQSPKFWSISNNIDFSYVNWKKFITYNKTIKTIFQLTTIVIISCWQLKIFHREW